MNNNNGWYLFEPLEKPLLTEEQVTNIAENLLLPIDNTKFTEAISDESQMQTSGANSLPAGFTYFGQFIAHDIVPKSNTMGRQLADRRNVSPLLNLESLYGDSASHSILFDSDGLFRHSGKSFDVYRDVNYRAIIPEPRNAENAIVLQFHRLWQRIHNMCMQRVNEQLGIVVPVDTRFDTAKRLTISLFQLITIDDYLQHVLHEHVYKCYFEDQSIPLGLMSESSTFPSVPTEFSHACFRFGHSMVQPSYDLSQDTTKTLNDLLNFKSPMTSDVEIDWQFFFNENSPSMQSAKMVSLNVAMGMHNILDNATQINIAKANIHAGNNKQLISGRHLYTQLQNKLPSNAADNLLKNFRYQPSAKLRNVLTVQGKELPSPLWLTVLDEARVNRRTRQNKRSLGLLTSIVVADVVRKSIYEYVKSEYGTCKFEELRSVLLDRVKPFYNIDEIKKENRINLWQIIHLLSRKEKNMADNRNIWEVQNAWVDQVLDRENIPPEVSRYMPVATPVLDTDDSFMLSMNTVSQPEASLPLYKMKLLTAAGQWDNAALAFFNTSTFYEDPHNKYLLRCNMEGKLNNQLVSLLMVTIEFDPKEKAYITTNFWEIKSNTSGNEQKSTASTTSYRWRG
ncbi:peroxidase family protein [Agaribacter marinus]|uniref:Animal haem peroxidase n=1 Tax=Agaribacter marinus TaxID=1431249 RepID=A0AA37T0Y8_9ALTE|nr:peroxidase family protein [Agaribacter marinus]GLR72907.1 hypothetical protein GCM10007852_38150 [Agaribacter marinus]